MQTIMKFFLIIWLLSSFFILDTNAWFIDLSAIKDSEITKVTIDKEWDSDIIKNVEDTWFSLLKNVKIVLEWILLIYIVYVWATMVMSMWSDDAKLTKAKTQLRYSLVAIVFINVPWVIYEAITFSNWNKNIDWWGWWSFTDPNSRNILLNMDLFREWILANIISAIEVFIFIIAIYVIVMAGIKMMTSRWRDEKVKEVKEKILYSGIALVFVGFIEAWKQVIIC